MLTMVSPRRLLQLRFGYIAARSVGAAVELGLFTTLAQFLQAPDVATLAERLKCSERGVRVLCQALLMMGLLEGHEARLELSEEAAAFLVESAPGYLGGMMIATDRHWNKWGQLAEAVKMGEPPQSGIESDADDGAFFSQFVQGLYNMNWPAAQAVAQQMAARTGRVADLGCGSGVWSIPWAQAGCDVVAVDRECILQDVTRNYVRQAGAEERYEFRAGNLRDVALEDASFDAVLLGHVLHSEGRERSLVLLRRCLQALRPGGKVVIAEMVPDPDRRTDSYGVLFGVNMLMLTEAGEVFTAPELEGLLQEAGFEHWVWMTVPFPYPVLVASGPEE